MKAQQLRRRAAGRKPAVMTDVARLAGVSYQTVSRVLHESPHVREDTRDRVLAAITALEYRPNSLAQALVTGRSRTLGVVSFDTTLYGPASTVLGVEEAAHDAGYAVSIASLRSLERGAVVSAVETMSAQGVDGIVVVAPQRSAVEALLQIPRDVPVVAVEAGPDDTVPVVAVDQRAGAMAATRHLLSLGHRTVHHLGGPEDWLEAEQRVEGWRAALTAAGVAAPRLLRGDWSPRTGYELGRKLLETSGVTAVFVASDQMALGLLRLLHEAGRSVPGDVSVVGFDDVPEAAYFTPPLTTIRQDFAAVGQRCLRLLLELIENRKRPWRREVVPPRLVVRESTAAPRGPPER